MKKAVLISIRPEWCDLIASKKKTIEVRKNYPKNFRNGISPRPFKCYIYCSKPRFEHEDYIVFDAGTENARGFYCGGMVIGEFICDRIYPIAVEGNGPFSEERSSGYSENYSAEGFRDCLTDEEFDAYLNGKPGYGWHISGLKIYDEPKNLSDFRFWNTSVVWKDGLPFPSHEVKRPPQSWCYVEELP